MAAALLLFVVYRPYGEQSLVAAAQLDPPTMLMHHVPHLACNGEVEAPNVAGSVPDLVVLILHHHWYLRLLRLYCVFG